MKPIGLDLCRFDFHNGVTADARGSTQIRNKQGKNMTGRIRAFTGFICVYLCLSAVPIQADDWPQWRGPDRNGVASAEGFDPAFGNGGHDELWAADLGVGFTGITIANGRAFTAGYIDGHTVFYCFNAVTGEPIWNHRFPTPIYDNLNVGGPSGTAAVDGDKVYHMARNGRLLCYAVDDGQVAWELDLVTNYGVEVPTWGFSGSPVVIGDTLYLDIGKIIALNKNTGRQAWATADLGPAYSTPAPFTFEGTDYLAVFPATGLHILNRATGNVVAHHPWTTRYGVNAATPVVFGDHIFISSDYNTGCAVLRFTGDELELIWENRRLKNQMCTSIYHDGYLYGFNSSVLTCIDAQTGERAWDHAGLGRGTVILAGQTLVVLADDGTILTAPATPQGFEPIMSTRVVEDTEVWTSPTLANGRLYVRGCRGRLVCVDVSP